MLTPERNTHVAVDGVLHELLTLDGLEAEAHANHLTVAYPTSPGFATTSDRGRLYAAWYQALGVTP